MVVVTHDLVGGELTAVDRDIKADDLEKLLPGLVVKQGKVVAGAGDSGKNVVKSGFGAFQTGSSQDQSPSRDRTRCLSTSKERHKERNLRN